MAQIKFNDIKIEEIHNSSGVFWGNNLQVKWKAFKIANDGYGSICGNTNCSLNNQSVVISKTSDKRSNSF